MSSTRWRTVRNWVLVPMLIMGVGSTLATSAGAQAVPGSQGTDTSLPLTDSAVTVTGRDQFADLKITVNQTEKLNNQAVSITWTGGRPTVQGPGRFGFNYLQIMQCWGDDDGTVPTNPGPPPEQCVAGAVAGIPGGLPGGLYPSGFALTRLISRTGWENYDPAVGAVDERSTNVFRPFRSVTGEEIGVHTDSSFNPAVQGGSFWLNPFFNNVTTNEIPGGITGADGRGAELFQVETGVQSSGLGCGQVVQQTADGGPEEPRCWIVVVPRGTPEEENAGTPFAVNADQNGVATSPLSTEAWKNRVAVPLSFNPVDSPCDLLADDRRISGNELFLGAIGSWQPVLCGEGDLPPYSYASVGDGAARQQLSFGGAGAPGMVVVSRPLDATLTDESSPAVYAPVALSGIGIGFNVERVPRTDAPSEAQSLSGVRIADLSLTPRLVAKLLTQSYAAAVSIGGGMPYEWVETNPDNLGVDPDFLRFNPEFELLQIGNARNFASLTLAQGNSDAALQVWEWILADDEAQAWLAGEPDEWGMVVNPYYSSDPADNPSGIGFGTPAPSSFPKSDPYCLQADPIGTRGVVPPELCGTEWVPYARSFEDAAAITRAAADRARIVANPFAIVPSDAWQRELPQFLGRRSILSLTDTSAAARYGLQMARLSRAGDSRPDRAFVAPDESGLTRGVTSMVQSEEPQVLVPDPENVGDGAYPLTALSYAALKPLELDEAARADYAEFIAYAATEGQEPGLDLGKLPPGYTPLPDLLRQQAILNALAVVELEPPPPSTSSTTSTSTTTAPPRTSAPDVTAPTTLPSVVPAPSAPGGPIPPVNAQPPVGGGGTASGGGGGGVVADSGATTTTTSTTPATTATPASTTTLVKRATDEQAASPTATPVLEIGRTRYAVAGLGVAAVLSALGALEISKRPRRSQVDGTPDEQQAEGST